MMSGALRTPIQYFENSKTFDEYNTPVANWVSTLAMRCNVINNAKRKGIDAYEKFTSNEIIVECYYRGKICEGMRAKINGVWYNVVSVIPQPHINRMEVRLEKINE